MRPAATLTALMVLLLISPALSARIIYVPYSLPTIQHAIDAASAGDTILVDPGTYLENIDFRGKAVTLVGRYGTRSTFLTPEDPAANIVRIQDVSDGQAVLRGFTISGGQYGSTILLLRSKAVVEENVFRNNILPDAYNVDVITCLYTSSIIRHNVFYGNGGIACIGLRNGTAETQVVNNTFDGNNRGIYSIALGGTVVNNIITNSAEYGVAVTDPLYKFDLLDNNDIFNNHPNYSFFAVAGPDDLSVDPAFVNDNAGDYHLTPGSPCIDAGNPDPAYDDPDGTLNDIGAYYYHQNIIVSCCDDVRGNVDDDDQGLIDIKDLHYLVSFLFKHGPEPVCFEKADVNGDGIINTRDLSCLARHMFSRGNPCSFADCP